MKLQENSPNQEDFFKVPTGYFEDFDQRLKNKMEPENNPIVASKITIMKPWIMMAAAFILLTMVYNLIPSHVLKSSHSEITTSLTTEEIESWTDEFFGMSELIDLFIIKDEETNGLDVFPDNLLFDDLTQEDFVLLSHLDY